MLKKDDRPQRKSLHQNVEILVTDKLTSICSKLISMVKQLNKIPNVMFAHSDLLAVSVQYAGNRSTSTKDTVLPNNENNDLLSDNVVISSENISQMEKNQLVKNLEIIRKKKTFWKI